MKKIIVANLKMNLDLGEIIAYKNALDKIVNDKLSLIVCPQYPYLSFFNNGLYSLGAQNVSEYEKGAFTGEVGARDLASLDVEYVLIGHYERKKYFLENDDKILIKIKNVIDNSMIPIMFIGESKEEKQRKKTISVIQKQIVEIFNMLSNKYINKIILAYEPIWAINSGKIPEDKEIDEIITFIKNFVLKNYKTNNSVLYGGSINEFNIKNFNQIKNIDGFVIGEASTNLRIFPQILKTCEDKTID